MEQRHGAAEALSAPVGRRDAVEETVTHTQASPPHLRGFTCAFTRRNYTHEALFSPQYMRINRLQGTKIMRCFPHCCPQHVSRSYCGASVYLQVDLDEFATAVTRDNEIDGDNVQVFGCFRLQEAHSLAVGEQVSLGIITSSRNSESNPTGEWVASRMIASAGHVKMFTFVLRQLGAFRSLPATPDSTGNNNAVSDNNHSDEQVADANELLIELSINLMLWMLFDRGNNAHMETFLQRSAKVLLDRVALYKSYKAWTEWLQERVGEYLFSQGWSQAGLVAEIEDILKTGKTSASSSSSAAFPTMIRERLVDESFFAGDAHVAAGYEMFVAQARELYIAAGPLSSVAQFTQTRIHSRQSGADQAASGVSTANFTPANRFDQLTGLWLSDWNAASCRDIASESTQTARQASTDIMSLLWTWKQLGCIRVAFSTENGVPALLIGSVFNALLSLSTVATENRVIRIVLDRQHHWFRCFPGGESSIGTRVGGQFFGDYVASGSGGADDFSVEIKCYS